jgi:hypothetical protein
MDDRRLPRRYGSAPPDLPSSPGPALFGWRDAPLPPLPSVTFRHVHDAPCKHVLQYAQLYDTFKHTLQEVLLDALAVLIWLCLRYEQVRRWVTSAVLRIPRVTWFVVLGFSLAAGCFAMKNLAAYQNYQQEAARPPAFGTLAIGLRLRR